MDKQPTEPDGGPIDFGPDEPANGDEQHVEPEYEHVDPTDCFSPPKDPCECYCLHCGRVFTSDQIWFQRIIGNGSGIDGFWMCPTPNCSGAGFTFDIFPTDPAHPANSGWTDDDGEADGDEEEAWDEDDDAAERFAQKEWDPDEADYAAMNDDDLEGEEWKLGLQPGERPPRAQWADEARKQWEEEQRRYDGPDERPRELDWSDRPDRSIPPGETDGFDDIPF
jgi:hypothetical protein